MLLLKCCLSVVVLCTYWQDTAAETNSTSTPVETPQFENSKENGINKSPVARPLKFLSIKKLLPQNSTDFEKRSKNVRNFPFGDAPELTQRVEEKRETENWTFNPFKPLFLFPILPFLFPPKDDNLIARGRNEFAGVKNDSKAEISQPRPKPFMFFDIAFNIRQVPLKNETDHVKDSKIIKVERLPFKEEDSKKRSRKRRNTKNRVPDFFDDAPLFPDSELDEFLPKPDLFFPDLSFHPKPVKKLSRRKRDEKKLDVKNDLKFFLDAFDEAFTRTKKELERTDPILNFIKKMGSSFGEEKKDADDFFNPLSDAQDGSNVKWKIHRNVKKLNDEHVDEPGKSPQSPVIIVDKVVKIGEFRLHDDNFGGKNGKWKKIGADVNLKSLEDDFNGGGTNGKSTFEIFKQGETKEKRKWKRNPHTHFKDNGQIKFVPPANVTVNASVEAKGKPLTNSTGEEALKYKTMLKAIDGLEKTFKRDFVEGVEKLKRNKPSYEELKKNITEVLNQFLSLVGRKDKVDLMEDVRDAGEDQDDLGMFDWTEKEILDSLRTRHKKDADFPSEYSDTEKKERQIADLNFLFLTVTLPTVLVFTLVLLVCFFSLRVKGKICTKLFNPRQVYVMGDDMSSANQTQTKKAKVEGI